MKENTDSKKSTSLALETKLRDVDSLASIVFDLAIKKYR